MRELPIFDGNRYPVLEEISDQDLATCCERFDACLDYGESASRVGEARGALDSAGGIGGVLRIHRTLFGQRPGAGRFRSSEVSAVFQGQDCPSPMFIERSLENLHQWLASDSFNEIHPIEQTASVLTRLVDIWPFDFGNRTTATVFASVFLTRAGYPPFFVLPDQVADFDEVLSAAIRMQTGPLVKTICASIDRELQRVRG